MGATRVPVVNPGNDPGRNQTPEQNTDSTDVRGGNYRDPQSMVENPGGSATTCKHWATEREEKAQYNAGYPRDRGNRAP